jgi:hypothetical protein
VAEGNERLELIDRIGGGAHGEVWRARAADGRLVAVKLLGGPAVTKEAQLRFFREQALRFDHPNLAGPRGVTEVEGSFGLVMELAQGRDLQAVLDANGGSLPDPVVASIARDVLAGLGVLHDNHVIHRDVTPSNVLVTRSDDGQLLARLGDFGSALDLQGPRLTTVPGVVGTRGYAAPELFDGDEADVTSDLWSLGATLAHLRADPPHDHDPRLDSLISALSAADPNDRPHSAADAARMLEPPGEVDLDGIVVPELPPLPRRSGRGRARVWVAAAAAVLAVGIIAGVAVAGRSDETAVGSGEDTVAAAPVAFQTVVEGTEGAGYDSSVGVDAQGRPVVAHTDLRAGNLMVTACEDRVCRDVRTVVADDQPRTGYYPSLRLTSSGLPVVAYQDSANGRLVVRRCADRACADSEVSEVPLPGSLPAAIRERFTDVRPEPLDRNVSLLPQLRLDEDVPVLTFDDVTTDQVWLARCSDPDCSGAWTVVPVGKGAGGSLALTPDGRPLVAGTGRVDTLSFGPVWVEECADRVCSSSNRIEPGVLGSTASIAADDTRFAVVAVSYVTPVESDGLVVLACELDCASPSTTRIGEKSDPDGNPTIEVDNGRTLIAYRAKNAPAPGLQFLDCAELSCAGQIDSIGINEEVPPTDRVPEAGHDVCVTLDPSGRMVVSNTLIPGDPEVPARLVVSADA